MVLWVFVVVVVLLVVVVLGINHSGQRDGEQGGEEAKAELHLDDLRRSQKKAGFVMTKEKGCQKGQ